MNDRFWNDLILTSRIRYTPSYKGADDLQVHSKGKIGMHPESAVLDIHCKSKGDGYLRGGNLGKHKATQDNSQEVENLPNDIPPSEIDSSSSLHLYAGKEDDLHNVREFQRGRKLFKSKD